jgi:Ser/Thr protein kinase RdoA (MazF antagonist)
MSDPPLQPIYSLADPSALEARISEHYFAGRPVDLELLSRSWTDVYRVLIGKERAVLRIWRADFHAREQIDFACGLIVHLSGRGIPVVPPIATPLGDLVLPLRMPEGERHMALFRWSDGKKLGIGGGEVENHAAGCLLARFHDAARDFQGNVRDAPTLASRFDRLGSAVERLLRRRGRSHLMGAMRAIVSAIDAPAMRGLPNGIVHGDFHPYNLLRGADGLQLIDFDDAGPAPLAADIAAFHWVLRYLDAPETCFAAFVRGYESVRPIQADEWAAMALLEAARDCWNILGWASSIDQLGDPSDMLGTMLDSAAQRFAALG